MSHIHARFHYAHRGTCPDCAADVPCSQCDRIRCEEDMSICANAACAEPTCFPCLQQSDNLLCRRCALRIECYQCRAWCRPDELARGGICDNCIADDVAVAFVAVGRA
jgi:hypothetical protein